jgi:O-antigen/teichoic acid export membrane protein
LNSSTLTALGKPSWRLVITGITAILNVGAFLFAARHGIVAVAVAVLAVGYLTAPLSYWALNRLAPIDVRTYFRHIRGPLLASLVLAGVMLGLRHLLGDASAAVTLSVVSSAGVVVYIAAIRLLAPSLAEEVRELVRRALPTPGVAKPAGASPRR